MASLVVFAPLKVLTKKVAAYASLFLSESSFNSIHSQNYTIEAKNNSGLTVYLRNTPPLKAGDSISFRFTGDFEIGKTYMVSADDRLYYSNRFLSITFDYRVI